MCNPAILPAVASMFSAGGAAAAGATAAAGITASQVAIGATLLGTGLAAYGQIQAGKDAARIERVNARNADIAAADALRRGDLEEQNHRNKVRALLGSQRATFGANNVDSNTGSPLGLLVETAQMGELDALTIRNNAAREAFGYRSEGVNSRARGSAAKKSGMLGGFSTALAGGAQAYGIWRQEKKRA